MRKIAITACIAALACACNTAEQPKVAAEPTVLSARTDTSDTPPMDSATMAKNWQNYMTPGKEQKMLASWNGTWLGDVSMWMSPDAPASVSKGVTTNTMILGGRYQQSRTKSTVMGMPFEGISTVAFDNAKKVFIFTWIDNMGTGIMQGEGPWDEASKSITFRGKFVDPGTGKDTDFREVMTITGPNTQTMEMYAVGPDGKEFRTMEIKYTRKK